MTETKERLADGELLRTFVRERAGRPDEAERAFEELVRRHAALIQGVCRRTLKDHALAEDAAQAVFIVLAKKADALQSHPSLAGWLYRTARFVASRAGRAERNRGKHEVSGAMPEARVEETEGAEALETLRQNLDGALERLGERDREAIVLHYLEQVPQTEAALALGISHEAFRQRLSRALERLRAQLAGSGAVYSSLALGPALMRLTLADGAGAGAAAQAWAALATGKAAAGTYVWSLAKGALDAMWTKNLLMIGALGLAACMLLAGAAMFAADQANGGKTGEKNGKAEAAQPVLPKKPAGEMLGAEVAETHVVLPVKGLSRPVFSPDGMWLALREGENRMVLIEMAKLKQDPKGYVPARFECDPIILFGEWTKNELGAVAAFSADSKRLIYRAPLGLKRLALPPEGEPKALPLSGNRLPFLPASPEGVWALLDTGDDDPHAKTVATTRPVRVVFFKENEGGEPLRQPGPEILPAGARWSPDGKALLANLQDQTLARIDPLTGKAQALAGPADFEKAFGKEFDQVQLVEAAANGSLLLKGQRAHPNKKGEKLIGAIVYPTGDEAPVRGEQPPFGPSTSLASYLARWENGKLRLIDRVSVYRDCDLQFVLPAPGSETFFTFSLVSYGRFERWEAFAGRLDASGKKTEQPMKGPVPEGRRTWLPLETSRDGSKALFLVSGGRPKFVKYSDDPKLLEELRKTHKVYGVTGVEADHTMEGPFIMDKYERSGCSQGKDGVSMSFATYSLGVVDGVKNEFRRVSPEFVEALGEFNDAPGIPGRSMYQPRYDWSVNAGYLAMVLVKDRQTPTGAEIPAGVVLIKIPAW